MESDNRNYQDSDDGTSDSTALVNRPCAHAVTDSRSTFLLSCSDKYPHVKLSPLLAVKVLFALLALSWSVCFQRFYLV